jgi:tRNA threonylcarbamoyladenosine biosynthesis protein TsaB
MSVMLLIDTALETASVAIAREGSVLAVRENARQNDHAAWLHTAIRDVMHETDVSFSALQAVGVTDGPGSYTGLRVGLSAAKGICYGQNLPLITVSTLQVLAGAVAEKAEDLIIPMIDARRNEVYVAVYDRALNILLPEQSLILTHEFILHKFQNRKILLTGNGALKATRIILNNDFIVSNSTKTNTYLAKITYDKLCENNITNLSYHEPLYLKNNYL